MLTIPLKKIVKSEADTAVIAEKFAGLIKPNDRIILNGQLGAGKTFFIKKVLPVLGINNVISPTFAIINEYNGNFKVYHFDFFRLKNFRELIDIGWQDFMNDESAITFIEWGNLLPDAIPEKRYEISITVNEDLTREIEINKFD